MSIISNIIKVTKAQYNTLINGGSITKNGTTFTYNADVLYLVEDDNSYIGHFTTDGTNYLKDITDLYYNSTTGDFCSVLVVYDNGDNYLLQFYGRTDNKVGIQVTNLSNGDIRITTSQRYPLATTYIDDIVALVPNTNLYLHTIYCDSKTFRIINKTRTSPESGKGPATAQFVSYLTTNEYISFSIEGYGTILSFGYAGQMKYFYYTRNTASPSLTSVTISSSATTFTDVVTKL